MSVYEEEDENPALVVYIIVANCMTYAVVSAISFVSYAEHGYSLTTSIAGGLFWPFILLVRFIESL